MFHLQPTTGYTNPPNSTQFFMMPAYMQSTSTPPSPALTGTTAAGTPPQTVYSIPTQPTAAPIPLYFMPSPPANAPSPLEYTPYYNCAPTAAAGMPPMIAVPPASSMQQRHPIASSSKQNINSGFRQMLSPSSPLSVGGAYGQAVLFVGQLNYDATEDQIYRIFSHYGRVLNVVLLKDATKNYSKQDDVNNMGKANSKKQAVGSSAFVTFGNTDEADFAIRALHDNFCMEYRDRPVQVSYCQKTEVISPFGYEHALRLHSKHKANPIPIVRPNTVLHHA